MRKPGRYAPDSALHDATRTRRMRAHVGRNAGWMLRLATGRVGTAALRAVCVAAVVVVAALLGGVQTNLATAMSSRAATQSQAFRGSAYRETPLAANIVSEAGVREPQLGPVPCSAIATRRTGRQKRRPIRAPHPFLPRTRRRLQAPASSECPWNVGGTIDTTLAAAGELRAHRYEVGNHDSPGRSCGNHAPTITRGPPERGAPQRLCPANPRPLPAIGGAACDGAVHPLGSSSFEPTAPITSVQIVRASVLTSHWGSTAAPWLRVVGHEVLP